jgi:D-3-phosphoglycerate dehydrogenase/C-terminal binding protein
MTKYRVFIADFLNDDLVPEREVLDGLADVVALDGFSEDDLVGKIDDADAIMLYHNLGISRATIDRLTKCRLIVRCGVGVDNVDHGYARQAGIPVANVPDYGTEEVADSAIGMLLAMARGIHQQNSFLRAGGAPWLYSCVAPLTRLRGMTLGLIGLGRIGIATALRGKAIGMDIAFYDPYRDDGYDKSLGIRRVETLAALFAESQVVSLHCPLTAETRGMIDAAALAAMPRGSYLVNTARGAIVDTAAIPAAIATGQLAGAAIDVLPHEPPGDNDPLLVAWRDPLHPAHHRLIVNCHAAFYSEEGLLDMRRKGSEACRRALLGERLRNVVN